MHAVGVPVLLCSSVISLRERNKKRHGKARTSSKGERGSKGKDKQKARELTHFIRRCVLLRVTEQSTTSRIAKQKPARSRAKSTKYVDERSKARRRRSKARRRRSQAWRHQSKAWRPKQSTTSLMLIAICEKLFFFLLKEEP